MTAETSIDSRAVLARSWARAEYAALTAATAAIDAGPARLRFGHVRTVSQAIFGRRDVRAVATQPDAPPSPERSSTNAGAIPASAGTPPAAPLSAALVTATLDVGGVETVVATLARLLPGLGVEPTVLVLEGGRTAHALHDEGVNIQEVRSASELTGALEALNPDVVEVHTATAPMTEALLRARLPIVSVLHSVELYRSVLGWEATARLDAASQAVIAVSRAVREDHVVHVAGRSRESVVVVPNGAEAHIPSAARRDRARQLVGSDLGIEHRGGTIALCLARYDIQKNIVGLVDAFVQAADRRPDLHLVVAGGISDWTEYARADALRRTAASGSRVHLLRESDSDTLLDAADLFIIDSYFEGWPVAVTEAVCRGLPVVMSEVGGAHELLGNGGGHGLVVPNAAGPRITARTVAAARRRMHQRNRTALAEAIDEVASLPRARYPAPFDNGTMAARHADVLRAAARSTR